MEMDKTFSPTVEWMSQKYDEMNDLLFGGKLGKCFFGIFTTGKGSEGRTLGWFRMTSRNLRINRYNRRIFKRYGYGDEVYADSSNFFEVCEPKIELNGNYTGTEHAFLATLVHEMCHYYTYMNGYAPKQGHGREFKEIGYIVSSRSNGMFTIQRLATAEEMTEFELNDKMKAKQAKRLANKKSAANAVVVYKSGGFVRLILTNSERLVYDIERIESQRNDTIKVIRSNDANLIDTLFSNGYKKMMRTYRYWDISDKKNLLDIINNSDYKELYENPDLASELGGQTLSAKQPMQQEEPPQSKQPKKIFYINTSSGAFEYDASVYGELFYAIKARFPNMKNEVIKKIMDNPANYRMVENKMNTKSIIKEVIEEFINDEMGDDSVAISPDMNLGLQSPLEVE